MTETPRVIQRARCMTTEDWRRVEAAYEKRQGYDDFTAYDCAELIGYRDALIDCCCDFEKAMLRGEHDGAWGAAIGAAIEHLRRHALYTGFTRTRLGNELGRVLRERRGHG